MGPPAAAGPLAAAIAGDEEWGVTLPAAALGHLPTGRSMSGDDRWTWRWTSQLTAAATTPDLPAMNWLTDDGEVADLLRVAHPAASALPGAPEIRRWAGIHDAAGRLVACAADITRAPDVGHIASVATHPDARGRGLGAAVSSWLARVLIDECGRVSLGHYSPNAVAQRLYVRLGFTSAHHLASGRLLRAR